MVCCFVCFCRFGKFLSTNLRINKSESYFFFIQHDECMAFFYEREGLDWYSLLHLDSHLDQYTYGLLYRSYAVEY